MALADIISRIEADAAAEAAKVVAAAEDRAAATRSQADAAAADEREKTLAAAETDAGREASRIVVAARLRSRDDGLSKRRALVDEALVATARHISELPDDRYAAFLAARIADAARGGEELRLGTADAPRGSAIAAALKQVAPSMNLRFSDTPAPFERGALLIGDRVQADLSLDAIVEERRDDLELVVADALFGEGA